MRRARMREVATMPARRPLAHARRVEAHRATRGERGSGRQRRHPRGRFVVGPAGRAAPLGARDEPAPFATEDAPTAPRRLACAFERRFATCYADDTVFGRSI